MGVPISQMWTVAAYIVRQRLRGRRRFPLVLMLEPLYRCNLSCAGCGKIQYPGHVLKAQLSVEDCVRAVEECPAPVVSIAGGEPLLHPQIDRIVDELVARKRYVYLCTNALQLQEKLDLFRPSRFLSFSVHMDGLREDHDRAVCRPGTYERAVNAIREAVRRGFRVTTNTTLYEGADPERTRRFFDEMMALGVEGMMISPGYSYDKAPDREHFLRRERTHDLFRRLLARPRRGWRFNQSPLFLEFLTGARSYDCTPWGNPTYGIFGWQRPCYLLQEGYARTFKELMEETPWERFGHRSGNPKCRDCMVHSGFEASAVGHAFSSVRGMAAMLRALALGPRVPPPTGNGTPSPVRLEAARPRPPGTLAPTETNLRQAFEFRGDVTLWLADGSRVEGYVSRVDAGEIDLFPSGSTQRRTIPRSRIRALAFTGRDMAAAPEAVAS